MKTRIAGVNWQDETSLVIFSPSDEQKEGHVIANIIRAPMSAVDLLAITEGRLTPEKYLETLQEKQIND